MKLKKKKIKFKGIEILMNYLATMTPGTKLVCLIWLGKKKGEKTKQRIL